MSFNQRGRVFWDKFDAQVGAFIQLAEEKPYEALALIQGMVQEVIPEIGVEIGGKHPLEVNLSSPNNKLNAFLAVQLLRLQTNQYEGVRFSPFKLSNKAYKEACLKINDTEVSFAECRVRFKLDEKRKVFICHVYHPVFKDLPEKNCYEIGYLILDLALGELWSCQHVAIEGYLTEPDESLALIDDLMNAIDKALADNSLNAVSSLIESYSSYRIDDANPKGNHIRNDSVIGVTRFPDFFMGYQDEIEGNQNTLFQSAIDVGVYPCFIYYPHQDQDIVNTRYNITDELTELLDDAHLAHMIGGETGSKNSYIDLLVYDKSAVIEILQKYFKNKNLQVSLHPYTLKGEPDVLSKKKKFLGLF